MGIKNRERRRKKHLQREQERRRQETTAAPPPGAGVPGAGAPPPGAGSRSPEVVLRSLLGAVRHDAPGTDTVLARFASGELTVGGRPGVAACLRRVLDHEVAVRRAGRWTPDEVLRVARQGLGAQGARIAREAMRTEWRRAHAPSAALQWAIEVERFEGSGARLDLAVDAHDGFDKLLDPEAAGWVANVAAIVALIALLGQLPSFPEGPPASSGVPVDEAHRRILERVRGLLAKAEATGFPEEADALTTKAQEALARHNIDRAALGGVGSARDGAASLRRIWIDDPYVPAKHLLLHQVAKANRCSAVLIEGLGVVVVAGHGDDLDTVELLFTSLLVQATRQLGALGTGSNANFRSRAPSFRRSFFVAFATRIGQRLTEAARASEDAGTSEHGSTLLPVLASRRSAAEEAIDQVFGELEHTRVQATDGAGWAAGTAAADLANLAVNPELAGARRAASG